MFGMMIVLIITHTIVLKKMTFLQIRQCKIQNGCQKWSDLRNFLPDTFHNQAKKVSK